MTVVTVDEAQPRLKDLLKQVEDGEPVVITTESGARLRVLREETSAETRSDTSEPALIQRRRRHFGQWAGRFEVGPEFFEPLPDEEIALWMGESERGRQLEQAGKVEQAGKDSPERNDSGEQH